MILFFKTKSQHRSPQIFDILNNEETEIDLIFSYTNIMAEKHECKKKTEFLWLFLVKNLHFLFAKVAGGYENYSSWFPDSTGSINSVV